MRSLGSLLLLAFLGLSCLAVGQTAVPVVMLSDIHFDPFHDPARIPQLRTAPIEHWPAILNAPASATQAADLEALQTACGAHALDTAWPLLETALAAAHSAQARPAFVTLSGDLLTHDFPCRFQHTSPDATPQDLSAFAAKTVTFVLLELSQAFPHIPLYSALGNNDSGCADYRETPGDTFLRTTGPTLASPGNNPTSALSPEGDYTVTLPAPFAHGRLIVLQDIFEARQFTTCGSDPTRFPETAQMDWLRAQLASARTHGDHVWVMAHIPPGVDVYTSYRRYLLQPTGMCAATPRPFLADTALTDALLDNADVVSLALFGHTHMDEIRLLHRDAAGTSPVATIPAKLVPSVTPIFGNHPAFLVASVDPRTLVLRDWRSFVSPGPEGSAAPWTESYRFSTTYHLPDFSAASAQQLANGFTADPTGQAPRSSAFREHFYAGDFGLYALGLSPALARLRLRHPRVPPLRRPALPLPDHPTPTHHHPHPTLIAT